MGASTLAVATNCTDTGTKAMLDYHTRTFSRLLSAFTTAVPTITFEDAPEAIQRGVKIPRKNVLNRGEKIAELITDGQVFIYRSSVDQFKWKAYRRDPFIQDVANYLKECHA